MSIKHLLFGIFIEQEYKSLSLITNENLNEFKYFFFLIKYNINYFIININKINSADRFKIP